MNKFTGTNRLDDNFYGFYLGKRIAAARVPQQYEGTVIDNLIDTVKAAEQRVTVAQTPSTVAGWALDTDNCDHCHAAYGHKHFCPLINRQSAEAASSLLTPTEADRIYAHALGVEL